MTIMVNNKKRMSRTKIRFINTIRLIWWLCMVTKEWTVKLVKAFLEKMGIVFYFFVKIFFPLIKKKLAPVASALVWVLVRIAALLWYMTANIILGKKGTRKLLDKKSRASSEVNWINLDPVPVCIWGACFVLLSLIIIPETSPIEPAPKGYGTDISIGISDDYSENLETSHPRMANDGERYYFTYDFSEVNYDESYLSKSEMEYLVLCVQHESGRDGSYFMNCADFGRIQRYLTKAFLNQRKNLGVWDIREMVSNREMFKNLKSEVDTIYDILSNDGTTEDLQAAGVVHPELYSLEDDITLNNVKTVLYGLDDTPETVLFWRSVDGYDQAEAWENFLYTYDDKTLVNCLSVMAKDNESPYGYHWLVFAEDNNLEVDI